MAEFDPLVTQRGVKMLTSDLDDANFARFVEEHRPIGASSVETADDVIFASPTSAAPEIACGEPASAAFERRSGDPGVKIRRNGARAQENTATSCATCNAATRFRSTRWRCNI